MNTFAIGDIFNKLYGYKPYKIDEAPAVALPEPFQKPAKAFIKKSTVMGSPIWGPDVDLLGREIFCPLGIVVKGAEYRLPYSLISLRRRKTIVETEMVERGGTAKELIGLKDWEISVKGFLINHDNQFPDLELIRLKEIFEANEPVQLKSALTDLFLSNIDKVVITDLDLPAEAKIIGIKQYNFQMLSDSIFTLTVDGENTDTLRITENMQLQGVTPIGLPPSPSVTIP